MGILDRFFKDEPKNSGKQEAKQSNWQVLETHDQLEAIKQASHNKAVAIFKHSIRCGVSGMVKKQLEREWNLPEESIDFYYLDLINHRSISNQIAQDFGVVHESPQLVVIQSGKVIYHDSHYSINVGTIRSLLGA